MEGESVKSNNFNTLICHFTFWYLHFTFLNSYGYTPEK